MTTGYNELVGLRARFSRVIPRYSLTHFYRWREQGETRAQGSMRSYDMHRFQPIRTLAENLRDAYAPAVCAIWRQETNACFVEYLQFQELSTPSDVGLDGAWQLWAEW